MTEDEARDWIALRFGGAAIDRLRMLIEMIEAESARQNLISAATLPVIWTRHMVDSAQLIALGDGVEGRWTDIGTGAGFPGLVVGALTERQMSLVEPRRGRVEFLRSVIERWNMESRIDVVPRAIEKLAIPSAIISARAVASVEKVLTAAAECATIRTRWLLPKGRNAPEEVATARQSWQGTFHVEHSLTDPASMIVVANGVCRR